MLDMRRLRVLHADVVGMAGDLDLLYVCEQTEKYRYGGRVAIGDPIALDG